ncbi:MAG: thioredoxin domain-containing protein [Legionella sp.]|nr:thioredoxin domain-containing protein [Legionella sp.]
MKTYDGVIALDTHNFEQTIMDESIVFVDFWATWCAPCTQFAVIYERVAAAYKNILFAKVDIEKAPELSEMFEIRSIPHLMAFKDGIAIYSDSGSVPESVLKELVEQALTADVSEIKEQLDADGQ